MIDGLTHSFPFLKAGSALVLVGSFNQSPSTNKFNQQPGLRYENLEKLETKECTGESCTSADLNAKNKRGTNNVSQTFLAVSVVAFQSGLLSEEVIATVPTSASTTTGSTSSSSDRTSLRLDVVAHHFRRLSAIKVEGSAR
jgi:hypothetical protein